MLILTWLAIAAMAIFGLIVWLGRASTDSHEPPIRISPQETPPAVPRREAEEPAIELDSAQRVRRLKGASRSTASSPAFAPLLPREFVVLDFETTGLDCSRHEIIEIGAIRANLESSTHATFQTLVKCAGKVSKKITGITGITQVMLDQDGMEISAALSQLAEFIGDLPIVTYNAEFDMGFLRAAANRLGLHLTNQYTCALQLARRAWPDLESHKLSYLAARGNLSIENAHRALGDCERALIIFVCAANEHGKRITWKALNSPSTEVAIN